MKYKLEEKKEQYLPYKYLIVWGMSERWTGLTSQIKEKVKWDEVTEYRCFDGTGEVHGIKQEEKLLLHVITDEVEVDDQIYDFIQESPLSGSAKTLGERIQIKRYYQYDEDGQAYIVASRCYGVEKGEKK